MISELSDNKIKYSFSFIVLLIFAFFRPIFIGFTELSSINLLEFFGIGISFLILIAILTNIKKIKLDFTTTMILIFCFYCLCSLLWGSTIREILRYTLPYLLFFLVTTTLSNNNQLVLFLETTILGFSYLILASFFYIIMGWSEVVHMYHSDYDRFMGVTQGIHALAHSMVFFTFFFAYYVSINNHKKNKLIYSLSFILFIVSIYCLIMTYTRTTFVGVILFFSIYLFFKNKKLLLILILMSLPIFVIFQDKVNKIIFQVKEHQLNDIDKDAIDHASSGRLYIWETNLHILLQNDISNILLGLGIGGEGIGMRDKNRKFISSHNDFISILMSSGIFGLIIYLILLGSIFSKILLLSPETEHKYFFIAFFISAVAMAGVSNSYIGRFEMTQYLWLMMGLIFVQNRLNTGEISDKETDQIEGLFLEAGKLSKNTVK